MSDWRPIATAPIGERILLAWKAFSGVRAHVELGKHSNGKFYNTYGQAFSGAPDYWRPLPEPPEEI